MDADPEFTELFRQTLRPYDDALVARIREDSARDCCDPTSTRTAWSVCSWAPTSASWSARGQVGTTTGLIGPWT